MKSARYPVSANGWQWVPGESVRETGQAPREPHQPPAPLAQLLEGSASAAGASLLPRSCSASADLPFGSAVPHQPSSPLPVQRPYPGALHAFGNVPLCFPLEGQHRGRRWKPSPFFDLNSTRFSSEEVGAFRCAKCLFLECTVAEPFNRLLISQGGRHLLIYLLFSLGK